MGESRVRVHTRGDDATATAAIAAAAISSITTVAAAPIVPAAAIAASTIAATTIVAAAPIAPAAASSTTTAPFFPLLPLPPAPPTTTTLSPVRSAIAATAAAAAVSAVQSSVGTATTPTALTPTAACGPPNAAHDAGGRLLHESRLRSYPHRRVQRLQPDSIQGEADKLPHSRTLRLEQLRGPVHADRQHEPSDDGVLERSFDDV